MPPLLLGIYDSEQKIHCNFMADAAGELRCLPSVPQELPDHGQFTDPACETPLFDQAIFAYVSVSAPVSIPLRTNTACQATRHSVGRLMSLPTGSARYELDAQGSCVESSSEPGGPAVALTDIMPPELWQAGTETAGGLVTPRLRVSEVETADGARFPLALFDQHWAQPCALKSPDSDQVACWPSGALLAGLLFSDAQCQSNVWRSDECVTATFAAEGSSFFSLAPYTGPVFDGGGLGCFARDTLTDTGGPYFSRGNPLSGDVLAMAHWQLQGSGRFRHRMLEDDQRQPIAVDESIWQSLYPYLRIEDREISGQCQIFWTGSGVRCLPDTVYDTQPAGLEFADAECTDPAYLCPRESCDGMAFMPSFRSEGGRLRAEPLRRAKDIGNRYWARIEGVCAPGGIAEVSFFHADGDVSWDEYPALGEVNGQP